MKNPQRAKRVKYIKRVRKWKKRSLVVLFSFIFLVCLLFTLIYTSLGIKLISYTIEKVMPAIKIEHVSGSLNDLKVDGFSMALDGVEVKVNQAALSLSGLCLIEGKICIKNLDASDVQVNINTHAFPPDENPQESSPTSTRTVISLPLPLELRKANLLNVEVNVDDMQFGLSSFNGSATWVNEKIYVFPTEAMDVKAIFADSPADVVVENSDTKTKELSINETINQLFNQPLISSLPTVNIPLDIYVNSLKGNNWLLHMGGNDYHFNNVQIQASTENNYINVKSLKTDAKSPYADANVAISGTITLGDDWPILANIRATTLPLADQIATEVTSQIKGQLLGTLAAKAEIKGFNQANIDAKINFIENYMPVTAKVNGKVIQWPILGTAAYQLSDFNVDLSGTANKYKLAAKGDFNDTNQLKVLFDMVANGTNKGINIKNLSVGLPQGNVSLLGKVNWLNALKWDATVNFDKIDLSKEIPNYPIKLDGQIKTDGSFDSNSWVMNLNDLFLKGNINSEPLTAGGSLSINSSQFISADKFNIKWGNNHIDLNGSTLKSNLLAELNLAELRLIDSQLNGHISGKMKVSGSISQPVIDSDLIVNNLVFQDIFLHHASLVGRVKYNTIVEGNIHLQASQFEMANLTVNDADIRFSGDEKNHHLMITVEGKPISTVLKLDGRLNQARTKWQGSLSQADISLNKRSSWQLNKPIGLNYDLTNQLADISAYCWVNNQSKICLDKNVALAQQGEAIISLSDIDLSLLDFISQGETKLAGTINGKANIKWDPAHKIPTIAASIDSKNMHVLQQIASQSLPIPFDLFAIQAHVDDKQIKFNWNFSLKEFGKFTGAVIIDEPIDSKRLSGQLAIDNLSLSIINPLLENNEHADGMINGHVTFSGTLLDPYLMGNISLNHSNIKTTQLPADIQSIMLDINFKGKSSILAGELQTTSGLVNIDGHADWQNIDDWKALVTVKGAAIKVTLPPMVSLSVIPDIRVEANQTQIDLTGKITIPEADIKVDSLPPSTVDVSSDEVMLDANLQEIAPQSYGMKINSRVLVSLGDKVKVDAFGLTARLTGNVYVTQSTKGVTVNGQINVPSGSFRAYGQDLIVQKGEIIFAGPPEQPRLNIEAIRNPESIENNVTAGIRVTGLADDPKVEIFSDPTMSQQEALSYLLRGQGLDSGEQGDNDMMTALLIGLATAQTGQFIGDIGDTFGIKNLSLDTQGVGDSQKVVVSGYILPRLQLKYGIGIFDSLATFTLRYRLLPSLYLEAVSGLDQTVDVIYQFEF